MRREVDLRRGGGGEGPVGDVRVEVCEDEVDGLRLFLASHYYSSSSSSFLRGGVGVVDVPLDERRGAPAARAVVHEDVRVDGGAELVGEQLGDDAGGRAARLEDGQLHDPGLGEGRLDFGAEPGMEPAGRVSLGGRERDRWGREDGGGKGYHGRSWISKRCIRGSQGAILEGVSAVSLLWEG